MDNVVGIYDTNVVYRTKLAEYFMEKSDIPLHIVAFSDIRQLTKYLEKECIDVFITGEKVFTGEDVREGTKEERKLFCEDTGMESISLGEVKKHVGWWIELVDSVIELEEWYDFGFRISRYQSSAQLLKITENLLERAAADVIPHTAANRYDTPDRNIGNGNEGKGGYYNQSDTEKFDRRRKGRNNERRCVIGIYSPVKRCGKTSLSVLLTEYLGKRGNSLLICMDYYSDVFSDGELNLAELIYCMSGENRLRWEEDDSNTFSEYERFVKRWGDISYLAAPVSVRDLVQISEKQMCRLVDMVRHRSDYDYVVIDLSEGSDGIQKVLQDCDVVFMPYLADCISGGKLAFFEKQLSMTMESQEFVDLLAKIHKIQLPNTIDAENTENYYRELNWSEFGNCVMQILEQYEIFR